MSLRRVGDGLVVALLAVILLACMAVRMHAQGVVAYNPVMRYKGAYAGGTSYLLNDVVTSGGIAYVSLVANNTGNMPVISPMQWAPMPNSSASNWYALQGAVALPQTCIDNFNPNWTNVLPGGQGYPTRYCRGLTYNSFSPGFTLGNSGSIYPEGWALPTGINDQFYFHGQGIHTVAGQVSYTTGTGDFQAINRTTICTAGLTAPSDQGCNEELVNFEESSTAYSSTVTPDATRPAGIGVQSILTACASCAANNYVGSSILQGVGQYLVESTPIFSGVATAVTGGSGGTYNPQTIALATAMPSSMISTAWGVLTTPCIPTQTQANTGTPCTFTVSVTSGTFTANSLVAASGIYHNQSFITSVSTTGGVATITMTATHSIPAGAYIYQGQPQGSSTASCTGTGVEFLANTIGPVMYVYDVVGCTDTTHLQVYAFTSSTYVGVDLGNVVFNSLGVASPASSNSSGLITLSPATQTIYMNQYAGGQTITIANSTNFNGQCTNVQLVNYGTQLTCSEAGITTALTDASASATFTLGTTGYGNSSIALHRMAQILDIRSPLTMNADGSFILDANEMSLQAGTAVLQTHNVSQAFIQKLISQATLTPLRPGFNNNGTISNFNHVYGTFSPNLGHNNFGYQIVNNTSFTELIGGGGTQTPMAGYGLQGPISVGYTMQNAPWPIGGTVEYVGCPLTSAGCSDTNYFYNVRSLAGASGGGYGETFTPYNNTMQMASGSGIKLSPATFLAYTYMGGYGQIALSGTSFQSNVPFSAPQGTFSGPVSGTAATFSSATVGGSAVCTTATGCGGTTATNLAGGGVGSLPYQSAANTTTFIPSPTATNGTFVPAWQPTGSAIAPTAISLNGFLSANGLTSNYQAITAASTIAPTGAITRINGTTPISTVTIPSYCGSANTCQLVFIPGSSTLNLTTGGNVSSACTAVPGGTITLTLDFAGAYWAPSGCGTFQTVTTSTVNATYGRFGYSNSVLTGSLFSVVTAVGETAEFENQDTASEQHLRLWGTSKSGGTLHGVFSFGADLNSTNSANGFWRDEVNNKAVWTYNNSDVFVASQGSQLPTYTVATLPSASTLGAGTQVMVSDATTYTPGTCVGGGSDYMIAVSNGSSWSCH